MAESTQFPPGMPNWLKKLMDTQRRGSEFWSGLEAGLPDYARTQAANFLNSASGSLGRLNEQVTGAHGQAADALSNAGTNAIGFGFQGADFLRGMMGSNPPTQNIPAVQTLGRAAEVIPQQLNATYGGWQAPPPSPYEGMSKTQKIAAGYTQPPRFPGPIMNTLGPTGPSQQFPAPYGHTGPFIPLPPTATPGGRRPMPTAQNPNRFSPIGVRPSREPKRSAAPKVRKI